MSLAKIFISAFLIDNVVILRFIALCPFIGMSSMAFMGFSGLIK